MRRWQQNISPNGQISYTRTRPDGGHDRHERSSDRFRGPTGSNSHPVQPRPEFSSSRHETCRSHASKRPHVQIRKGMVVKDYKYDGDGRRDNQARGKGNQETQAKSAIYEMERLSNDAPKSVVSADLTSLLSWAQTQFGHDENRQATDEEKPVLTTNVQPQVDQTVWKSFMESNMNTIYGFVRREEWYALMAWLKKNEGRSGLKGVDWNQYLSRDGEGRQFFKDWASTLFGGKDARHINSTAKVNGFGVPTGCDINEGQWGQFMTQHGDQASHFVASADWSGLVKWLERDSSVSGFSIDWSQISSNPSFMSTVQSWFYSWKQHSDMGLDLDWTPLFAWAQENFGNERKVKDSSGKFISPTTVQQFDQSAWTAFILASLTTINEIISRGDWKAFIAWLYTNCGRYGLIGVDWNQYFGEGGEGRQFFMNWAKNGGAGNYDWTSVIGGQQAVSFDDQKIITGGPGAQGGSITGNGPRGAPMPCGNGAPPFMSPQVWSELLLWLSKQSHESGFSINWAQILTNPSHVAEIQQWKKIRDAGIELDCTPLFTWAQTIIRLGSAMGYATNGGIN